MPRDELDELELAAGMEYRTTSAGQRPEPRHPRRQRLEQRQELPLGLPEQEASW